MEIGKNLADVIEMIVFVGFCLGLAWILGRKQ